MEVKFMCPAIELCCEGDTFDIINKHALFTYDVCLFKPETHHATDPLNQKKVKLFRAEQIISTFHTNITPSPVHKRDEWFN